MLRTFRLTALLALAVVHSVPALASSVVTFTFIGLQPNEQVMNYYNGGVGSLGSGPGANYQISFSPNSYILGGTHGNLLTSNGAIVMNVGTEFANSFKLGYVTMAPEIVSVWNGFDGTGILLATITLMPNGWCHGVTLCGWAHAGVPFSGAAASVTFSGADGQFGIGSVKLGTHYWTPVPLSTMTMNRTQLIATPEPSAAIFLVTGLGGLLLMQALSARRRALVLAQSTRRYRVQ